VNNSSKTRLLAAFAFTALLPGCVVWQSDYDKLQAENQQLQQQVSSQAAEINSNKEQINRLIGAIKYTVNSDLAFAPGSWQMSARGQQIIAGFAQKLAPTQQSKLLVAGYTDNTPIGPELMRQGVTSNQDLSQKRADAVMAFLISQGVKPDLLEAKGFGEADPVSPNDTPADRAKNRRVELSLAPA
jgi:chemotaxis protein MotB